MPDAPHHPNLIGPLPFEATAFEVMTVDLAPGSVVDRRRVKSADQAVETAQTWVCPRVPQVSITAHHEDVATFAVRHLTHDSGVYNDSGWRCWIRGEFVGAGVDPADELPVEDLGDGGVAQ